jgi:superfamily II DNA/RNA helicase
MTSFVALGVSHALADALTRRGIATPFPVQSLALPDALAGRDVLGRAKTGSGKTLAFGLPTLARVARGTPGRPGALILAPTRELAMQIHDELAPLSAAVDRRLGVVVGGMPMNDQTRALRRGIDVLVATPGRLIDLVQRGDASLGDVRICTVDEADRMADLGFLPQVEWLLRHVPSDAQQLLFSATLDGAVAALARRMTDPVTHSVVETEPTVESMTHRFLQVHRMDKTRIVAAVTRAHGRTIVFCRTKRACDRVADELRDLGVSAGRLHGDLDQSRRNRAIEAFIRGSRPVLVATDVAARGIHVDDVEVVVHFDPAEDHKAYLHRSGRTARAGATGLVVSLVEWDQELVIRRIQRRLGLSDLPHVAMFSNDARLANLASWDPVPAGIHSAAS